MRSETDIVPLDKRTPGVQAIEPLIFPVLEAVYTRREKRLRLLAEQLGEAEGGYFKFLSCLVEAQQILKHMPLGAADVSAIRAVPKQGCDPDHLEKLLLEIPSWQQAFLFLVQQVGCVVPETTCTMLGKCGQDIPALTKQAASLLCGEYAQVDAGLAVVLWAALSVCWAQAVEQDQEHIQQVQPDGEARLCPCCGAQPVASLVLGGDREGLRYLQCSLCETRWHRVRGICVECGASAHLEHWTFEDLKAPVQAESCGDCKTYLKVFRLDYNPELDALADDLGSFALDTAVEQQGFARAGLNPFSFPG
ncbi:formate dehydrogenase accessory protein FdhE [Acetobacter pasteurianus]|uniref:formate dehydrogenase accessory protein FdhE n=1 Tax=Acetobacter pasteurianus TaxID=438 RepID=UPI000F5880F7|nr:formate dehydrogenase accessory protein FdhE [Acetobacter pasteurianus]GCD56059.1 formate dehydrogenase accessory protein [Acetobacter pasteurianus NBRC 3222]